MGTLTLRRVGVVLVPSSEWSRWLRPQIPKDLLRKTGQPESRTPCSPRRQGREAGLPLAGAGWVIRGAAARAHRARLSFSNDKEL